MWGIAHGNSIDTTLSTVIAKLAKEHGKDVYNFLVDIISEKIDPKTPHRHIHYAFQEITHRS